MQGSEYKVSGLSCCDRSFDGILVSHFTDKDYVRVLSQTGTKTFGKACSVFANLTLVDDTEVWFVYILYRILQSYNVIFSGVIDFVQHGCQSGGLTGTSLTSYQNDSLVEAGEFQRRGGKPQGVQSWNRFAEQTDGCGNFALLFEYMASAADSSYFTGKIKFSGIFQFFVHSVFRQVLAKHIAVFF